MHEEVRQSRFFLTPEHPCSYLADRTARTLFLDPRATVSESTYETLSRNGFRRSGAHLYRPHCAGCKSCIPTRIPVGRFRPGRRFRRVLSRNADLSLHVQPAQYSDEIYALYARYLEGRHFDGDMYPPSPDQFRSFLLSPWANTLFVCATLNDRLVSVGVTDHQSSGLSAIYTFFEPELSSRSLGTHTILRQIDLCREYGLPHLYLGYWIRDAPKMRYKTDFRPVELLVNNQWIALA